MKNILLALAILLPALGWADGFRGSSTSANGGGTVSTTPTTNIVDTSIMTIDTVYTNTSGSNLLVTATITATGLGQARSYVDQDHNGSFEDYQIVNQIDTSALLVFTVNPGGVYKIVKAVGTAAITLSTRVYSPLSAQVAAAGGVTNGSTFTAPNLTTTGTRTNLEVMAYTAPDNMLLNVDPVPNVYFMPATFGSNAVTEALVLGDIDTISTNGFLNYGENYYQIDAGWASYRDANGHICFNTNTFTHNGKWIMDYAHSKGVRVGLFVSFVSSNYWGDFGQVSSYGHEVDDAWQIATNFGADGIKIDNSQMPSLSNVQLFIASLYQTGLGIYRQGSLGFPQIGNRTYSWAPQIPRYFNSAYLTDNLPDTYTYGYFGFTNFMIHFEHSLPLLPLVKPGFYLEGIGWVAGGTAVSYDQMPYPFHIGLDLAVMTCSRVMVSPSGNGLSALTNSDWLGMLRDPLVIPCKVAASTAVNSIGGLTQTNYVLVRQLGALNNGVRALCFVNSSTNAVTMYVTNSQLMLPTGPATFYSPYFRSFEAWSNNVFSVSVPPTNTLLYKVYAGTVLPSFTNGVNYLSDQNWRMNVKAYTPAQLNKDFRDNGGALVMNGVTYAKGFCAGFDTNAYWEIPLGGQCSTFNCTFGKHDAWGGAPSAGRLTIGTNGVQAFQSGWVSVNSTMATNVSLSLIGVQNISFLVETNGYTAQYVLGNCIVSKIANGDYSGTFTGNGSGLTNLNAANGIAFPPIATYAGPVATNGVARQWNSNGVVYLRYSAIGGTTWTDKQIAP